MGAPTDIVVYDLDGLKIVPDSGFEVIHDCPAGEWRRVQKAKGYRWILVNGEVTFRDGQATWNEEIRPSWDHGVTTAIMGCCGVGIAPVNPGNEGEVAEMARLAAKRAKLGPLGLPPRAF